MPIHFVLKSIQPQHISKWVHWIMTTHAHHYHHCHKTTGHHIWQVYGSKMGTVSIFLL
jgi:hypothetical protein